MAGLNPLLVTGLALVTTAPAQVDLRPQIFATDSFASVPSFSVNCGVGDVTGDGRDDIVMPVFGDLVIHQGNGDGTFDPPTVVTDAFASTGWTQTFDDANGDGLLDLIITDFPTFRLTILFAQGGGTFSTWISPDVGTFTNRTRVANLDGDAIPDLVVSLGDFSASGITAFLGNGDDTFSSAGGAFTPECQWAMAVADLDGDGLDDAIPLSTPYSFFSDGDGTFTLGQTLLIGDDAVAADLDEDGALDLVASGGYLLNDGDGFFTSPPVVQPLGLGTGNNGQMTQGLLTADFDLDGHADIAGVVDDALAIAFGDGTGALTAPVVYPAGADSLGELGIGDFDGDGRPDVAAFDRDRDVVVTWLNRAGDAPWVDLGSSLAGTLGDPTLDGVGFPGPGFDAALELTRARPLAPVTLVVGFATLELPLLGGVLVPEPTLLVPGLVADAGGALELPFTWPEAPLPDVELVVQAWIVDEQGPAGWAASNGLAVDLVP